MISFFRRNKKGQVAIFIVLVFQVLFILFAMSLNVAMVVYDKINFQNSLDLATYYGAKKQAEVLNAMAHINYQMRQNWKLLSWRYRILGTLTQYRTYDPNNPNPQPNDKNKPYWCPQNQNKSSSCAVPPNASPDDLCRQIQSRTNSLGIYPEYCDKQYFTCISHNSWSRGVAPSNQVFCDIAGVKISPITKLPNVAGFLPEAHISERAVDILIEEADVNSPEEGALNWLMVQMFLTHFRLDQKDRRIMIEEIYNKTLKEGKDLEGEKIKDTAKRIFYHNLTKTNQSSVDIDKLQEFQSFEGKDFNDFFEKLIVRPVLNYLDFGTASPISARNTPHFRTTNPSGSEEVLIKEFINRFNRRQELKTLLLNAENYFKFNKQITGNITDPLDSLVVSFFKKPEKILYYGLAIEFDYEGQIFSLGGPKIVFKGSAFAKPFGASFGPQPKESDPFIPTKHSEAPSKFINIPKLMVYMHQPNYSRWPGDKWGLIDRKLHDPEGDLIFLNKIKEYKNTQWVYNIKDYFNGVLYVTVDDPLARPEPFKPLSFVRLMEWMAVYPDLYDINHYSILANYHQTYFKKICKLLGGSECKKDQRNLFGSSVANGRKVYIRGDFGWSESDDYIGKHPNKDISIAPYFLKQGQGDSKIDSNDLEPPALPPPLPDEIPKKSYTPQKLVGSHKPEISPYPSDYFTTPPLTRGNLFYPWLASSRNEPGKLPGGLLSSWFNIMSKDSPLDYQDYSANLSEFERHFLSCDYEAIKGSPVSSSCVGLGRTGYSVKLISCEAVEQFSDQPPNMDVFCN